MLRVRSRRGEVELRVSLTERIERGHVFTAFHFPEVRTNLLIGPSADVNTSCPEYKVVAVCLERVTGVPGPSPREERAGELVTTI
jgi:predicted molibdopterin-dependent oxidoreductase YjgC